MKKIICAFSGGPDSVFLVYFLQKNFPEDTIIISHFNHNLRGKNSDDDAFFAQNFAKENNLIYEQGDWEFPVDSEEKARNARYKFLESIRKKYNADWISTGHHQDDVVETILLQFFRGGGLSALSGIHPKNPDLFLWRPLLSISKQEILEYLSDNKIVYCSDESNSDSKYTRNFLRNDIIPQLEKRFPQFGKRIGQKTNYFSELQDLVVQSAENFLLLFDPKKGIEKDSFLAEKFPVRCEIIKICLPNVTWSLDKFLQIENFLQTCHSGKKIEFKNAVISQYGENFFIEDRCA